MVELKKKQNKTTKALEDTYCTNYFYIKNILDNEQNKALEYKWNEETLLSIRWA